MMDTAADIVARQAREVIARNHLLPAGSPVVLMVSGGGDSVALLRLLADGSLAGDIALQVLHVDHGLRGEESSADARFVADLCESLGVACTIERVPVADIAAAEGLNLEDAGRRERYRIAEELLDELCDAHGVGRERGRIVTAHTRDDRVETFLMRLAQGAGATGLTSLRFARGRLVRPLLTTTREQLRAYLLDLGQAWREDATNADVDRLRAKVRHELLPLLQQINPRFDETLGRTLLVMGDEDQLMREMGEAFARDFAEVSDGEVSFDSTLMATLSRPMQRRTVRAALLAAFPETSRIEFEHVETLVDGLGRDGFAHDLPGGLRAHDEYGRMVVSRTGEGPEALAPCLLPIPGICDLGSSGRVIAEETSSGDTSGSPTSVVVDLDVGTDTLTVNAPREGDRFRPLGMQGTKKVSDLLVDEKVPRRRRPTVPVVRDGDSIVWVAGVRMSEEYKVTPSTTRAVRLSWEPLVDSD